MGKKFLYAYLNPEAHSTIAVERLRLTAHHLDTQEGIEASIQGPICMYDMARPLRDTPQSNKELYIPAWHGEGLPHV